MGGAARAAGYAAGWAAVVEAIEPCIAAVATVAALLDVLANHMPKKP